MGPLTPLHKDLHRAAWASSANNSGNFANDRERAAEAGQKGGHESGGQR
ncbi:general stress protein [Streptomyces sp. NPDC048197]